MDAAEHDALLIVDAVSSVASVPFDFDRWRVDICLTASQKGLMLPPGLGILCVGPRALEASEKGGSRRSYFDWRPIIQENAHGFFPYTPATLLLFGLREALRILVDEEGLPSVFGRHRRLAQGVRAAVRSLGLSVVCEEEARSSETLTAVRAPGGTDSGQIVGHARDRYGVSLGVGLGRLEGLVFRIGHLGALGEAEVLGVVATVEMTLNELGADLRLGSGVEACERAFIGELADATTDSQLPAPAIR
jgi:alanine-glyoxylate transaminase/serine-glyoxylate transaminase/serine-pyruvate transaminase